MEAGEALVKAAGLFKTVLEENEATLELSLAGCPALYVPKMPYEHRHIWFSETLYLFCLDEVSDHVRGISEPQNRIYINSMPENILLWLEKEVEYNLHIDEGMLRTDPTAYKLIMPISYQIDSNELIRVSKLLAFM